MQSVLSEFLAAGLLPIGEEDEKLRLLESAAGELVKKIKGLFRAEPARSRGWRAKASRGD
jgi:hypothetical protein